MKNLTYLAFLGILIFTLVSCSKTQVDTEVTDTVTDQSIIYAGTINGNEVSIQPMTMEDIREIFNSSEVTPLDQSSFKTINTSTNGNITTSIRTMTFSAMQNNGGVHGESEFACSLCQFTVEFDSDCITVVGNRAFFGGEVTVFQAQAPINTPWGPVGTEWDFYIAVEDNGQGANASAADALSPVFFFIPPGLDAVAYIDALAYPGYAASLGVSTWCDWGPYQLAIQNITDFVTGIDPTNVVIKN